MGTRGLYSVVSRSDVGPWLQRLTASAVIIRVD